MIGKYIKFDTVGILEDYDDNRETLKDLKQQLEDIASLNSIDYSKDVVQTSPTSDGIVKEVIRKQDLEFKVARHEALMSICDKAWNRLTSDEKTILDTMHRQGRNRGDAISYLCEYMHIEKSEVYNRRNVAMNKFTKFMFG